MKAARIDAYGAPSPAPGEVLIRMEHAGINVMDVSGRLSAVAGMVDGKAPLDRG